MKGLTRYILRQNLTLVVSLTVAFSAAVWLVQSLRLIDLIVNRGLSIGLFLDLAFLILPRFVYVVLPIAIFLSVLFSYNRLIAESELVVMRTAGMSQLALAKPALFLAAGSSVLLFALSAYLLPAANRAFKDLQFEIRNRFASALLQEGTFNTISENLTVYVRRRDDTGELVGLLVQDRRDSDKPVTIVAERGAFVDTETGPRVLMFNGNRQQFDRTTDKLSVLSFDRYTLDLGTLHDAPGIRFRQPDERYFHELLFPSEAAVRADPGGGLVIELHARIVGPLAALVFAVIPLACLLPGEFNRRGQGRRIGLAVLAAFLFETADIGVRNLTGRSLSAIPLLYLAILLPLLVGAWLLLRDRPLPLLPLPRASAVPASSP